MNIPETILLQAIQKYGDRQQIAQVAEECLELALELHKLQNREPKPEQFDRIIDEIADVNIMIAQANIMFDREVIQQRIDFKLERLKQRIESNVQ